MTAQYHDLGRHPPVHVKTRHRARDQRQQRCALGRHPPDPAIPPVRSPVPPRTSSPVIAGMYVPGDPLQPEDSRDPLT
jgi:hypothetical protein